MLDPTCLASHHRSGWDLPALTGTTLWSTAGRKKYGGRFPFLETAVSLSQCLGISLKPAAGWFRFLLLHLQALGSLGNRTPGSPTLQGGPSIAPHSPVSPEPLHPAEPRAALQAPTCARKQPQKCLGDGCGQGGLSSLAERLGMGEDPSASSASH